MAILLIGSVWLIVMMRIIMSPIRFSSAKIVATLVVTVLAEMAIGLTLLTKMLVP